MTAVIEEGGEALRKYKSKLEPAQLTEEQWREVDKLAETGEWLDNLPPKALRKYMGQWIAVKDKRIVASADTYAKLSRMLEELSIGSFGVRRVEGPELVIYGVC